MKRYDLVTNYRCGGAVEELEPAEDGEWVRYEDVVARREAPLALEAIAELFVGGGRAAPLPQEVQLEALRVFILQERNMKRLTGYQDDVLTAISQELDRLFRAAAPRPPAEEGK